MGISKELTKGSTGLMILSVLSESEMYGYQIIQEIGRRSSNVFRLNEGTIYPILHALEKEHCLESHWSESETGRDRKYYKITAKGELLLKTKLEEWGDFTSAVNGVLRTEA